MTVPSTIVAAEHIQFTPALPDKIEAAHGLPLGHDDKLFMSLDGAEEFPDECPAVRAHRIVRRLRAITSDRSAGR